MLRTWDRKPCPGISAVSDGNTIAFTPARTQSVATRRCVSTEADGIAMIAYSTLIASVQCFRSLNEPSTL